MALADSGEDTIMFCNACDYAANLERAESRLQEYEQDAEVLPMKAVLGENLVNFKAALEQALVTQTFQGKEAKAIQRATRKLNRLAKRKNSKGLKFRKAKRAVMKALRRVKKAMI